MIGTCDNCDRFGPLMNRAGSSGEGSFCPSCLYEGYYALNAWSDAYADLHADLEACRKLLGEAREALDAARCIFDACCRVEEECENCGAWIGDVKFDRIYERPHAESCDMTTVFEAFARIDAHLKEKP
ncbi:MAG TPA: hypothetical protein VMZ92_21620 [Planctomycetota bacterium]|nr:hypothetical protein [Planctomycetota bacterium]